MGERHTGRIRKFFGDRGFGFIEREGAKDLFVHITDVEADSLQVGQQVEFSVGEGPKGPKAVDVRVVASGESKGQAREARRRNPSTWRRKSPRHLPLYASEDHPGRRPPKAHAGLWYDKFCDTWAPNFRDFAAENGKRDWIFQFDDRSVGDAELLAASARRQRALVEARGGDTRKLVTRSRFVTGLGREHPVENGFAWHPTLGVPYLPGSGVKGVVRSWVRDWERVDEDLRHRIFGSLGSGVGSVVFLDALPTGPTALEADVMTPHYGPWYQQGPPDEVPADWHSPTPILFLTVAPHSEFQFGLLPRRPRDDQARKDVKQVVRWLEDALDWLGAGAKTAVGYGRFER